MMRTAGVSCTRRRMVCAGLGAALAVVLGRPARADASLPQPSAAPAGTTVRIQEFWDDGSRRYVEWVPRVRRSEAQWRALLSPLAYEVTRQGATEPAFSGQYLHNHAPGIYRCLCCGTALFGTRDQYDAGDGWPGFRRALSRDNLAETLGKNMDPNADTLAVSCRRCAAHLGLVSADGPPPGGLRYSIDSVALRFAPASRY
jgi:peptide-methionine (R)-S-oxide reductase